MYPFVELGSHIVQIYL